MKPRTRRLTLILGGMGAIGIATALVLQAFQENLVFFYTPTQITNNEAPANKCCRVGGMVVTESVKREPGGLQVEFLVTDTAKTIPVRFTGILPDLFQEGKGVVAQGQLNSDGVFIAAQVLAKHDENYMPPEAKEAVDQATKNRAKMAKPANNYESK